MDQANDVISSPLNSCLSERYDEYLNEKFSCIWYLFYRNTSNFHTNILSESLKENLLLGWPKNSFSFFCTVALIVLSCL